jgi:uncharacterized protein
MRIVLDTNVLVSGLISPHGPPGRLVDMVVGGSLAILVDDRILREYAEVLTRPRFGFDRATALQFVALLAEAAERVDASHVAISLPDSDDAPFLEVAVAGSADVLVTGNARHFKTRDKGARDKGVKIPIVDPATALVEIMNEKGLQ